MASLWIVSVLRVLIATGTEEFITKKYFSWKTWFKPSSEVLAIPRIPLYIFNEVIIAFLEKKCFPHQC